MTKREAENYGRTVRKLDALGINHEDSKALFRIERTLHRWHERECNGEDES